MRRSILGILCLTALQSAHAEPVFMPQARSVFPAHEGEAGVGAQFGYQSYSIEGNDSTSYKDRVWQIPLFGRFAVTDALETQLSIPVVRAVDSSDGPSPFHYSGTGIGNIAIGTKWNFLKETVVPVAAALDLDLPTANSANHQAALGNRYSTQIQEGFNTHLRFIADSPKLGLAQGHVQVGYMNTGAYTTAVNTRFNPSDLFTFGASVECDLQQWIKNLSVAGEFVGNTGLSHSKTNSTKNGADLGTVLEAGPSMRYQMGRVRTYAGLLIDDGKTTFRAYNYRVNFGLSVLIGNH